MDELSKFSNFLLPGGSLPRFIPVRSHKMSVLTAKAKNACNGSIITPEMKLKGSVDYCKDNVELTRTKVKSRIKYA